MAQRCLVRRRFSRQSRSSLLSCPRGARPPSIRARHCERSKVDRWYTRLVRDRITVDDVRWASALLAQLTDKQWRDAFRAGGFEPNASNRFSRKMRDKIAAGESVGGRRTAN